MPLVIGPKIVVMEGLAYTEISWQEWTNDYGDHYPEGMVTVHGDGDIGNDFFAKGELMPKEAFKEVMRVWEGYGHKR